MIGLLCFVLAALASPFKSKVRLEAESAVLRHQLNVLKRRLRGRVQLTSYDRWFFIQLYRWFPTILEVLIIIRPETLLSWHRAGFRSYWRMKSRRRGGSATNRDGAPRAEIPAGLPDMHAVLATGEQRLLQQRQQLGIIQGVAWQRVSVPKTLSELITRQNCLCWWNDRVTLFCLGRPCVAVQVEGTA